MDKPRILFVCTYNGTRARMAESFALLYAGDRAEVFSSSFEHAPIGELPKAVMREIGIEISEVPPVSIFSRARKQEKFDYVVTMCETASSSLCPVFVANIETIYRGRAEVIHWSISRLRSDGTAEDQKVHARTVRESIRSEVLGLLEQIGIEPAPPSETG